jgi:putative transposase
MAAVVPSYKGFRYPAEIISHCVWLYHRFPLSFREVEEMMMERGVVVSHETIRQWCQKFGQTYANGLRHRRPRRGDKWHLDEVFITINGTRQYLWRAVDQDGNVLDILVTSRRDAKAATRFFRKLLTGSFRSVPRVLITDKLASYGVAHRRLMPSVEHRRPRATVPIRVQRDITALPSPPPLAQRRCLPPRNDLPLRHLERRNRPSHS